MQLSLHKGDQGWLTRHKAELAQARHTFAAVHRGTRGQHVIRFSPRDLYERTHSPLPVVRYLGPAARALREVAGLPEDLDEVRQALDQSVENARKRAERRCFWLLVRCLWRKL